VSMRPELAAGVRSLEIKLTRPDGSREVLLWVRDAHELWPTPYVFKKPVSLPADSVLQTVAYFDRPPAGNGEPPFSVAFNLYRVGVR